ncbi:MAG TPA: amino acid adenylation domain-containing protein, partial [Aquella sp.]|nr:amino acid adenylation domain-containing protein [Aquella sp.]
MLKDLKQFLSGKFIISKHDFILTQTIHQLFQEQVNLTPNNIAIVYKNTRITYNRLNQMANQLAHYLRDVYQIKGDDLVILCLDRSEFILISILAILKAGGAYVPLDPLYPKDRISYILKDVDAKAVITQENMVSILANGSCPNIFAIDSLESKNNVNKKPITDPILNITGSNLAYVIYTSGTTGRPKGVLQPHCNIVRLFSATNNLYHFKSNDVWTLFHSYVFDFSIWEIWGALFFGGKLIIVPLDAMRDAEQFYILCKTNKVTVLSQTPNAFYKFIDVSITKPKKEKLLSLRYIIFGGDNLSIRQLKPWFDYYGDKKPELINMYGITETTVHSTYKKLSINDNHEFSNIGRFLSDTQAYILDNDLNSVPNGVIGELYLGGNRLAHGYLNLPELTKERFINNPLSKNGEVGNNRLYKTGDLVRYLPNGDMEYVGRNDRQVKIHGFRIELREIEMALLNYPGIKQAVVLATKHIGNEENNQVTEYIVGYYVSKIELNEIKVFNYLYSFLPEYMIPNILIHLTTLPLTMNGKLDRAALLNYEYAQHEAYLPPTNEIETELCNIWAEILKVPNKNIGIYDNFFRLGGDSVLAVKLVNRINSKYNCQIKIVDIFISKTVKKLTQAIKETKDNFLLISNLNETIDKPNLFMIHPAMAGSEVYVPLAQCLSQHYSCYGIDNYNLNNYNKIDNLTDLAEFYLSAIDQIQRNTNGSNQSYTILGWSLGGQ